MAILPSASYSLTMRLRLPTLPEAAERVAIAIGELGGELCEMVVISEDQRESVRGVTVNARNVAHQHEIVEAVRALEGINVLSVDDCTFALHDGGKISVTSKAPLRTRADLSMAYTPGVARVCMAVHDDPMRAYSLTIKRNTVAVVSDGTAVLGLGDIG
ncbi:MAG TPA: NAD-dependent malic enzyme, partial [Armatimonadota bacterium]